VFQELQKAAPGSTPAPDEELALWDCVRKSILDDSDGRKKFGQFLRKESGYFSSKDEVLRLERLIANLQAQGQDTEEDEAELERNKHRRDAALDELRPLRLALFRSIAASVVCRLGTETQRNALFTEQVEKARLLPEGQDPLKYMQNVIKEAIALCWQAHGVSADKQATLENELARVDEDADLKLLRPATKWATTWCLKEFPKPNPSKTGKAAKSAASATVAAPTKFSATVASVHGAPSASACVTLADVTAPVEQKRDDGKSSVTELNIPVKITCEQLSAGRLIRVKAVDCVLGGQIAHFMRQDGKQTVKIQEAKRDECATLVLKVMHQPGLLVSEKPHTEMCITSFDEDTPHSRWSGALLLRLPTVSECVF
jgi:hypothetical protein